jgi:hypothetical protein
MKSLHRKQLGSEEKGAKKTKAFISQYNPWQNGTTHFKKCNQLFEYLHLLLLRDIWWSEL